MRKLLILLLLTFIFLTDIFAKENSYYLILKNKKVNVRYGPGFDFPIKYVYKKKYLPPVKFINVLKKRFDPYCSVATWYLWRSIDPEPIQY